MKITSDLFSAFLKCPTKCYLRSTGQSGSGNAYAEWVRARNEAYQGEMAKRLIEAAPDARGVVTSPADEDLKTATWRLALDLKVEAGNMEARPHGVERMAPQGGSKPTQFVPIRFIPRNKLTKDDRLLVAFDALVLSNATGLDVSLGKIIHGDEHTTMKLKIPGLVSEAHKLNGKATALLSAGSPPDLILNRHCGECEFRDGCRQKALEKDDLSLLGGMSAKERQKHRSKGIFTVTQLSYTFRPRRRPKRLRDRRERYHHPLKALAIREKKIHIVGTPGLKIEGTPVYLDVEGLPDRDSYYLIGARFKTVEGTVHRSFWADTLEAEQSMWSNFTDTLAGIEGPVLIHYGSFETAFLRTMVERYGKPAPESVVARAIDSAINVLSIIFAQVYFPAYSNGLKEIAGYMGYSWSDPNPSGLKAVMWRHDWERTKVAHLQQQLINYNADDCQALESVTTALVRLGAIPLNQQSDTRPDPSVVHTELMPHETMWPRFSSHLPEFEQVNKAARWDYQRDRVYVRSSKRIRKMASRLGGVRRKLTRANKRIIAPDEPHCPRCGNVGRHQNVATKVLYDLAFSRCGLKRWVVEYLFRFYWCKSCRIRFGMPAAFWPGTKFGRNLLAYVAYEIVELSTPQRTIRRSLERLFGHHLQGSQIYGFKARVAGFYKETRRAILDRIVHGSLVHVDETKANVRGKAAYVWVFTNLHEVVYLYSASRESEVAALTLSEFQGVLVSDFYSGYDSFVCPQQKCLLHLVRDLNTDILRNPYDEELKRMIGDFAHLLKEIVETVDRFGLKKHFLHKHHTSVDRFYRQIAVADPKSETALKCKQRFEKNRDKLFTFLDYDGVPWNNNNAEHAIKAFAALRDVMEGSSTQTGIEDYLILLSVCETCKYSGVDFLDFLLSGETDIDAYAQRKVEPRRSAPDQPF